MSTSLFTHFWRSSGGGTVFWLTPMSSCRWVLGWWPEDSMVCLDLPKTIFMTSASLLVRGVAVWSPWKNNPHQRLSENNGSSFYSPRRQKHQCVNLFFLMFYILSRLPNCLYIHFLHYLKADDRQHFHFNVSRICNIFKNIRDSPSRLRVGSFINMK